MEGASGRVKELCYPHPEDCNRYKLPAQRQGEPSSAVYKRAIAVRASGRALERHAPADEC
jgi:hypothetical protein